MIRKLDTIKWWNWPSEKLKENVTLLEKPEEFLAKFYSPELDSLGEKALDLDIDALKQAGKTLYAFVLDFHTITPLWQRVVRGFIKTFHNRNDAALLLFFEKAMRQKDIDTLNDYIASFKEEYGNLPLMIALPAISYGNLPYKRAFRKLDYFIASKEHISSYCIDCLSGTDAKIVSAMDDSIFPGEKEGVPIAYI